MVDASKYVVLDVETNGLSSVDDDLLSISIYKPDTETEYNRFLPLEKNKEIVTTHINGITIDMLYGLESLLQDEVDELVSEFELNKRIILTYGDLDERFIKRYFLQHNLKGCETWNFYNFKRNILALGTVSGLTKDNFCKFFGIENVTDVHSSINDCILEWHLFERLDNQLYLVNEHNQLFKLNESFIFPASYIKYSSNLKHHKELPKLELTQELVCSYKIPTEYLTQNDENIRRYHIVKAIYSLLNVTEQDNTQFIKDNSKNIKYIGLFNEGYVKEKSVYVNCDGAICFSPIVHEQESKGKEVSDVLKDNLREFVDYLKKEIFVSNGIVQGELVIDWEENIMSLCDLSSDTSVVDFYGFNHMNLDACIYRMYYKANGRNVFLIKTNWWDYSKEKDLVFDVYKISITSNGNMSDSYKEKRKHEAREQIQKKLDEFGLEIVSYTSNKEKMTIRCKKCNEVFKKYPKSVKEARAVECPFCS